MDLNGGSALRHRRSSSSDRFLDLFSFSPPSSTIDKGGDELNEDDVLWVGDEFTGTKHQQLHRTTTYTTATATSNHRIDRLHRRYLNFHPLENSGILAALPESDPCSQTLSEGLVLYRKPSISSSSSSSKTIASIPRPLQERDYSQPQSVACRKFHQSAPMKVPVLSKLMEKQRNGELADAGDEIDGDEMLPPHEIVARGSGMSPKTTFSVLEGVGRTLKGRDLRQVRNAIWRKTGFLD